MKPTPDSAIAFDGDANIRPVKNRFPITDYDFQSIALDGYRGHCAEQRGPSFRKISQNYFDTEARQTFAGEAAFFAMIIITSALPVINSIHALSDFVRAIGGV